MPRWKRKRPEDEQQQQQRQHQQRSALHPSPSHSAAPTTETVTRRTTRQTPIPPPIIPTSASPLRSGFGEATGVESQPTKPKRRGRPPKSKPEIPASQSTVPNTAAPSSASTTSALQIQIGGSLPAIAQPVAPQHPEDQHRAAAPQEPRMTRRRGSATMMAVHNHPALTTKDVRRSGSGQPANGLVAPEISYQVAQPPSQPWTKTLMRPSPPTSLPPSLQPPHHQPSRPPTWNTHVLVPNIPYVSPQLLHQSTSILPQKSGIRKPEDEKNKPKPLPRADRNIDKVVLGDICFRTWYPSYYGKELLGDASSGYAGKAGSSQSSSAKGTTKMGGAGTAAGASSAKGSTKHKSGSGGEVTMLDRLYVCPYCFKYSKELVSWLGHVRFCERSGRMPPGRKIYTHPRGRRSVLRAVPEIKRGPGKRTNSGVRHVEEVVTDYGEWSVWEVDGEQDMLFCQNLSLFAKLFLDTKSVFFDVTNFNYFLLVYTPPPPPVANPAPGFPLDSQVPADTADAPPHRPPQVVGFFSKEKMSWDNNNLACILVFPPWQRKGLGGLLMGVSYEMSRRERILGGPEKPISELGRKGYKRYWAGEIARWLLGVNGIASPMGDGSEQNEVVVDLNECSRGTWIALDDCLVTLREMGLVEDAGMGAAKRPAQTHTDEDEVMGDAKAQKEVIPVVPRVRIDKEAVRRWVAASGISLERACDPNGFIEGYAIKPKRENEGET
ncbi:hypothetical protein SODALDRAFT_328201 [Sodiomyces alkalinus F11]|uniref:histone acetyltransferase n=1 Tax=Sodiomyces alkalinus (strain CBS 110278 / VKM F-3762 / F11) TaxID=1314773 RepID=A0A3N2PMV6_SODAK|nr:hypothetical protein SODALDRAFT_328201 [Sodiomyces alkalinus F11]ROT35809.1 hypothetical protein SODALDRAFT_328201 [Sodiomyces alkalinus F11]